MYSLGISSAEVDVLTGNIINGVSVSTTVDTEGNLTSTCANRMIGSLELSGEWGVYQSAPSTKLEPESLLYMCADSGEAYIPTETWTGSDGLSCACTADYEISCQ